MKSVTLVNSMQIEIGAKKGTQCPNLGNYINGMIGMGKQHWHYQKCIGAGAKYRDTPKYEKG